MSGVLEEQRAAEDRVLVEGNERREPIHHFDRCDNLGTISDTVAQLRAKGYRVNLDLLSGDLFAERVA